MEALPIYRLRPIVSETQRQAQLIETILSALAHYFGAPAGVMPDVASMAADAAADPGARVAEIAAAMRAQQLSGRALARKAGISPGTLSEVLRGKMPLTDALFEKLQQALQGGAPA